MDALKLFIRLSRPVFLIIGFLCYTLGAGIAKYLGVNIDWGLYWLGQSWVSVTQLSGIYFYEYFNPNIESENPNSTPLSRNFNLPGISSLLRQIILIAFATCLTGMVTLSIVLFRGYHPTGLVILLMIGVIIGSFLYSAPPIRLVTSGYGELTITFLVAVLLPVYGFVLQKGELHRLLAMTTFPLFALHLAMMISLELPHYASDLKHDRNVFLVRVGWQRSMLIHNLLILCAFLILSLALIFGMPYKIGLPVFLVLPLGLLQIWQMRRIADGHKPDWTLLTSVAVFLFGSTVYLLSYSFWIR